METWREADDARKQKLTKQLRLWEEARDLGKHEKRRVGWAKPKRGKLEGAPPRPGVNSGATEAQEGGNEPGSDEGMRSDGGSEDE